MPKDLRSSRFTQAICSDKKKRSHVTDRWLIDDHPFWHKGRVSVKYRHSSETSRGDRSIQKTVTGFMFDFAMFHIFRDGDYLRYVDGPSAPKYFFAIPTGKNYEWLPNTDEHKESFMNVLLNDYRDYLPYRSEILLMQGVPKTKTFSPLKSAEDEYHGNAYELWAAKILRYGGLSVSDLEALKLGKIFVDPLDYKIHRWTLPKRELPELPDTNSYYDW